MKNYLSLLSSLVLVSSSSLSSMAAINVPLKNPIQNNNSQYANKTVKYLELVYNSIYKLIGEQVKGGFSLEIFLKEKKFLLEPNPDQELKIESKKILAERDVSKGGEEIDNRFNPNPVTVQTVTKTLESLERHRVEMGIFKDNLFSKIFDVLGVSSLNIALQGLGITLQPKEIGKEEITRETKKSQTFTSKSFTVPGNAFGKYTLIEKQMTQKTISSLEYEIINRKINFSGWLYQGNGARPINNGWIDTYKVLWDNRDILGDIYYKKGDKWYFKLKMESFLDYSILAYEIIPDISKVNE